jgi:hypothetical protein
LTTAARSSGPNTGLVMGIFIGKRAFDRTT